MFSVEIELNNEVLYYRFCKQNHSNSNHSACFYIQPTEVLLFAKTIKLIAPYFIERFRTRFLITRKPQLCGSPYSALRSIQVLCRHFGLGNCTNILSTPMVLSCLTFKVRSHMIESHDSKFLNLTQWWLAKLLNMSKCALDYSSIKCLKLV